VADRQARTHCAQAQGREDTFLTAVIRPRLPKGRQARPDLTLVKSGKKEGGRVFGLIPSSIDLLEGFDQRERQLS
jgi:hypothetical protein